MEKKEGGTTVVTESCVIPPPDKFKVVGNPAESWTNWYRSFDWWSQAIGLDEKPEKKQAAVFFSLLDISVQQLLFTSLAVTTDEMKTVASIKKKLDDHFIKSINKTY